MVSRGSQTFSAQHQFWALRCLVFRPSLLRSARDCHSLDKKVLFRISASESWVVPVTNWEQSMWCCKGKSWIHGAPEKLRELAHTRTHSARGRCKGTRWCNHEVRLAQTTALRSAQRAVPPVTFWLGTYPTSSRIAAVLSRIFQMICNGWNGKQKKDDRQVIVHRL